MKFPLRCKSNERAFNTIIKMCVCVSVWDLNLIHFEMSFVINKMGFSMVNIKNLLYVQTDVVFESFHNHVIYCYFPEIFAIFALHITPVKRKRRKAVSITNKHMMMCSQINIYHLSQSLCVGKCILDCFCYVDMLFVLMLMTWLERKCIFWFCEDLDIEIAFLFVSVRNCMQPIGKNHSGHINRAEIFPLENLIFSVIELQHMHKH